MKSAPRFSDASRSSDPTTSVGTDFASSETSTFMSLPRRIVPLPGYTPGIGTLLCMLTYTRETTLLAVAGLSRAELSHHHDDASNSIGELLAHAVAVERIYQVLTFEARPLSAEEEATWSPALELGSAGRSQFQECSLEEHLDVLADVRRATLVALASSDDAWLDRPLQAAPDLNAHWAWFHVAEDEINHRGQIRWLRARLPRGLSADL